MKLSINKKTKIKDVQKIFSEIYPYLKVEFYKKPHGKKELSSVKDRISPEKIISEVGKFKSTSVIDINEGRTVADLEAEFYKKFGIALQVSRRIGKIWIETSLTDHRSLGMQNEQGKMASTTNKDTFIEQDFDS